MLRAIDTCTWAEHGTPQCDPGTRSLRTTPIRRPPTSPRPPLPTQFTPTSPIPPPHAAARAPTFPRHLAAFPLTLPPYVPPLSPFPANMSHTPSPPRHLPPKGPFGNPRAAGFLGADPPQPPVLPYRIAARPA